MEMEINLTGPGCPQFEALLEGYLDGDLDPVEKQSTEDHLASCDRCSRAFQDAQQSAQFFSVAAPFFERVSEPRPEFARLTMARIRVEKDRIATESFSFWQPFVSFAWRFAATAMLALMILLTYAARGHGRSRPVVGLIGQQPVADVLTPDPTRAPANQDEFLLMMADTNHVEH